MKDLGIEVGERVKFSKTVAECDIYQFAGLSGDYSPNHVNEEFMKATPFGHRVAHGVLMVAFASTASTLLSQESLNHQDRLAPVSLGYDRVRFLKPVLIGDTITVTYTLHTIDPERMRTVAKVEAHKQNGDQVMAAEHIMKWIAKTS